jgi:hypothetical protein
MIRKPLCTTLLACCITFAACSVDEGDDMAYITAADSCNEVSSGGYIGKWHFISSDKTITTDKTVKALYYYDNRSELYIESMPLPLLMAAVGHSGSVLAMNPFTVKSQRIGYSESSFIYRLEAPDYEFSFNEEGKDHQLKVSFQETSEMELNSYQHTLSVTLVVKAIYLDGELAAGEAGYLSITTVPAPAPNL